MGIKKTWHLVWLTRSFRTIHPWESVRVLPILRPQIHADILTLYPLLLSSPNPERTNNSDKSTLSTVTHSVISLTGRSSYYYLSTARFPFRTLRRGGANSLVYIIKSISRTHGEAQALARLSLTFPSHRPLSTHTSTTQPTNKPTNQPATRQWPTTTQADSIPLILPSPPSQTFPILLLPLNNIGTQLKSPPPVAQIGKPFEVKERQYGHPICEDSPFSIQLLVG